MLTKEAHEALELLAQGAKFNCLSVVSRELIAEGLAFDGWGYLEISEAGRRVLRRGRVTRFEIEDPNISNMGDMNEPKIDHRAKIWQPTIPIGDTVDEPLQALAAGSRDVPETKMIDPSEHDFTQAAPADVFDKKDLVARDFPSRTMLVWSRERAIAAAGVANGVVGVWVDQRWVQAFMLAYEAER